MLGFSIDCEIHTNLGRIDATIKTENYIYVVEFKIGTSQAALKQIKEKMYHQKYLSENKKIILMGIGFDKNKSNVRKIATEIIEK